MSQAPRRLKIVYLHQYFVVPDRVGGTRSYELARRWVAAGHEVHMVTSDREVARGASNWRTSEEAGIHVHWIPIPYRNDMPYPARVAAFLKFAWAASIKATRLDGDLVYATSTPLTIAIPGILASRLRRRPMVFEVRDLWPELPIAIGALKNPLMRLAARALERIAYRSAKHVVALSPGMAQGVVDCGIPRERVTIASNSCDRELFDVPAERGLARRAELKLGPDTPLICYIGTFGRINGVEYLVRVAQEMKSLAPEVRFLLMGRGMEWEQVKTAARAAGVLDDTLFLRGPVNKSAVPDWLSAATMACSLFVPLEPMWHNSANKFFDALASGTPVAINYGGWQQELLEQTGAGVVLPHDDPRAAAERLAEWVRDPQRLAAASQAGLKLAATTFDRDRIAADIEQVLLDSVES